jgi:hypothetical protein
MRSAKCIWVLVSFLAMSHAATAACSLDNALDFLSELQVLQTEVILSGATSGATQQQMLAEFGDESRRLEARLPQDCRNEFEAALARANSGESKQCELLNGAVERQLNLESYRFVAGFNWRIMGDRQAFKSSLREIMKNRLTLTPQLCWFSAADMSENGPRPPIGRDGQCAQLRAVFDDCQRNANRALQP